MILLKQDIKYYMIKNKCDENRDCRTNEAN